MIPPQLYYPDPTSTTDRTAPTRTAPYLPFAYRGTRNFPPGIGRPPMKQSVSGNRLPNKRRDKLPLRRRHPGVGGQKRPLRLRGYAGEPPVRITTTAAPSFFEDLYASLLGGNEEEPEQIDNEIRINSSPQPIIYHTQEPQSLGHHPTIFNSPPPLSNGGFTRHVGASLYANNDNPQNNLPFNTVPPNVKFAPSQHLGPILSSQNAKLEESIQSEASRLDQALALSRPVQAASHLDPNVLASEHISSSQNLRQNNPNNSRPPPRPQRIDVAPFEINEESVHNPNFLPSPKEGSMLADAFQPIFRASQSLDEELPASFMKPMHVASARALSFAKKPAPPPEVLNFFEGTGARPLLGLNSPILHRD